MKYIENSTTWNLFLEVIEFVLTETISHSNSLAYFQSLTKEELETKAKDVAEYSYQKDIETKQVSEAELEKNIREGVLFNSHIFTRLARHFYLEEKVLEKDRENERKLMQALHWFLCNGYYYKAGSEVMKQLCRIGIVYAEVSEHNSIHNMLPKDTFLNRQIEAALYFKQKGMEVQVKEGEIYVQELPGQSLFELLERKIATVGGNYVLQKVFDDYIGDWYAPRLDRFLISRSVDDTPNVPLNLLINLAVKHLKPAVYARNSEEFAKELEDVFSFAKAWLEISGIQGTSGMEYAMMKLYQFPLYLKNEMIFEKMCLPVQYNKRYILLSLDYLIQPWFDTYSGKGYSYKEYRKAAEYILNLQYLAGYLDIEEMKKSTGISRYKLREILEDISWEASKVNAEYTAVDAATNLQLRPLVRFPMERYFLLAQKFCGMGFYYAAEEMITANLGHLGKLQGPELEKMLLDEMKKKGYNCIYGKYAALNGLNEDECDLVLQGEKINFFEIKKRMSADQFDLIDDVSMLQTLGMGMVKAQKQCYTHERYLKKNGSMTLKAEDGKIFQLNYDEGKGPSNKVSICFSEYSFLTSKSFTQALMEVLMLGEFKTEDAGRQKELDTLNKLGKKIQEYALEISATTMSRELIFNSLFCSMQQILLAVWLCDTEEEFLQVVGDWIYSSDKTLDPYISLIMTRIYQENPEKISVRKSAIDMLKRSHPYSILLG